jgi:hypothetical protein
MACGSLNHELFNIGRWDGAKASGNGSIAKGVYVTEIKLGGSVLKRQTFVIQ